MEFFLATIGILGVMLGLLLLLARAYPGSGADILDWKPARSYEFEAQLETEDLQQMIDAQNERRRASGRPEISADSIREEVAQAQFELDEMRAKSAAHFRALREAADAKTPTEPAEPYESDDPELEDLRQLLELHNASRRRKGLPEVSEQQFREQSGI